VLYNVIALNLSCDRPKQNMRFKSHHFRIEVVALAGYSVFKEQDTTTYHFPGCFIIQADQGSAPLCHCQRSF